MTACNLHSDALSVKSCTIRLISGVRDVGSVSVVTTTDAGVFLQVTVSLGSVECANSKLSLGQGVKGPFDASVCSCITDSSLIEWEGGSWEVGTR